MSILISPGILKLLFADITTEIRKFSNATLPRRRLDGFAINRTPAGAPNRSGPPTEVGHIWVIDAILDDVNFLRLKTQWDIYCKVPGPWTIHDTTEPYAEVGTATRLAIPDTPTDITTFSGKTLYYPQWRAEPNSDLDRTQLGIHTQVSITFAETTKIPSV